MKRCHRPSAPPTLVERGTQRNDRAAHAAGDSELIRLIETGIPGLPPQDDFRSHPAVERQESLSSGCAILSNADPAQMPVRIDDYRISVDAHDLKALDIVPFF